MEKRNKAKLFDIKRFPMDMARLVCIPALILYRMKRFDINGKKYKGHLKGGALIVSNHIGFDDPFVVGTAFWYRRMYFLASETVMCNKLRSFLLKGVGCIKIDRNSSDIEAIRKSTDVLKAGRLLSMFPQGGISDEGAIAQIKAGAVLIALQADVPIVPTFSQRNKHWWQRRKMVIGEPINIKEFCGKKMPSMADINRVSAILLEKLEECRSAFEKTDS